MKTKRFLLTLACVSLAAFGCSSDKKTIDDSDTQGSEDNPFKDPNVTKADTGYVNPDGTEVEVDLEADIDLSGMSEWERDGAPALIAQYATTYLRKSHEFYLESLAEDSSTQTRVEWRIGDEWKTSVEVITEDSSNLTHFRIRGVNAVLLNEVKDRAREGEKFIAWVPMNPSTVLSEAQDSCADEDESGHITLSQDVYWYQWNPDLPGCRARTQMMNVVVSKVKPIPNVTYPEYDRLVADGKVTAALMFGAITDGSESDIGVKGFKQMNGWLLDSGFAEVPDAPVGRRFSKHIGEVDFEIDVYSPSDFSGLGDSPHFANFQRALSDHEIVVYDGHSMLGASDFWGRPEYPKNYQIYLYSGCLGYEYYVRYILKGKGGWDNVDIISSVIEVNAGSNVAGVLLAKLAYAFDHKYSVSWNEILTGIRKRVRNSTFGASGVRENCYSPSGSLCGTGGGEAGAGGGSGEGGSAGTGEAGTGGSGEAGAGGDPVRVCIQDDQPCLRSNDCCSQFCEWDKKICLHIPGDDETPGAAGAPACKASKQTCEHSVECCSDFCRSESHTCL